MSDVLTTLRPGADQDVVPQAPADTRPEPGLLEQAGAAMRDQFDRAEAVQGMRKLEAYGALVDALEERGLRERDLMTRTEVPFLGPQPSGELDYARVWREAKRLGIEGLPATQQEFERQAYTRDGANRSDQDTMARGGGVGGTLAQFGGQMIGSLGDPINVASLPVGGVGRSIAARVITEGLVNAGIEGHQAILSNPDAYANLGEEYGAGDAARDIGAAFVLGAGVRGGIEVAPKIDAAGYRAAAPVRERFDRFFADRNAARAFAQQVPAELRTPEQQAALHILEREGEIDEASPYARTYAGDDAHRANLERATEQLVRPRAAARGASPEVSFAQVKAAIRGPESSGDDTATNAMGSSASGRYQFIKGTFTNLYRKVYGGSAADAARAWNTRRFEVGVQERLMDRLLTENAAELRAAGLTADTGNLYAAHVLGAKAAIRFIRAAPETPVSRFVSAEVIAQNPTYFGGGKSVSEALAIIRGKVGGQAGAPVRAGPELVDTGDDALTSALDAEAADIELTRVRNAQQAEDPVRLREDRLLDETAALMRPLVSDRSISLNKPGDLADALELPEPMVRQVLDRLVDEGVSLRTRSGIYRRKSNDGPEDLLRFIANRGGLSYDGLGPKARAAGHKGDNLRNTGTLDYFVPRAGPLLRPEGRGVDEMGELLHDAGYFGPPATTPRPSEAEVVAAIEEATRTGKRKFSSFDDAPEAKRGAGKPGGRQGSRFQGADHEQFERARWNAAAARVLGRQLSDDELFAAMDLRDFPGWVDEFGIDEDELLDITLAEMVNRQLDEAIEDAFLESEDQLYDALEWQFRDAAGREGRAGEEGGAGSSADGGDAGEGGAGGAARPGDAGEASDLDRATAALHERGLTPSQIDELTAEQDLGPSAFDNPAIARAFDDDAGDGVQAAAESDWHDIRAETERPNAPLLEGGRGEDPNIADRQRQEAQLGAEAPLRAAAEQDGEMGLGLFDAADQPKFDLDDGKGPRSAAEIEAEIAADRAGLEEIRKCLM